MKYYNIANSEKNLYKKSGVTLQFHLVYMLVDKHKGLQVRAGPSQS